MSGMSGEKRLQYAGKNLSGVIGDPGHKVKIGDGASPSFVGADDRDEVLAALVGAQDAVVRFINHAQEERPGPPLTFDDGLRMRGIASLIDAAIDAHMTRKRP